MTTPAELLLARLEGIRETGRGRWIARCPSHADRRPSLSIREAADGRLLLYCFTGCGAVDVVESVGLSLADLFPREAVTYTGEVHKTKPAPRIPASDALELVEQEAYTALICAQRIANGEPAAELEPFLRDAASRLSAVRNAWLRSPA